MPRDKLIICELSANGFGSPEAVARSRADLVLDAYEYLTFTLKYREQVRLALREDDE